ncbi:MAG: hypothetical protein KGI41_01425 [Patescibacteria group bacterium]|nr:hypothetical protein [Patescibacteria group bacterium]MDE1965888.1 hypothetical protein [Patescibacteria group bacterium]
MFREKPKTLDRTQLAIVPLLKAALDAWADSVSPGLTCELELLDVDPKDARIYLSGLAAFSGVTVRFSCYVKRDYIEPDTARKFVDFITLSVPGVKNSEDVLTSIYFDLAGDGSQRSTLLGKAHRTATALRKRLPKERAT